MSAFLMLAALLALLALSFIALPLLAGPRAGAARHAEVNLAVLRDQLRELERDLADGVIEAGPYRAARAELERRVLDEAQPEPAGPAHAAGSRRQAAALSVAVLLGACALYLALGTPRAIHAAADPALPSQQQAEAMVKRLAERMQSEPGNAQGWLLLARSYTALQRHAEAGRAYAQLLTLVPADAALLTSYADVLAVAQGNSLRGQPEQLLARALALDPNDVNALMLFGAARFERGDDAAAIAAWDKIAALAPADSDSARMAANNLADARARLAARATQ